MAARLVLVRHAKSDYPWGVGDHDRPLNERGRRDAPEIGAWLDEHVGWVDGADASDSAVMAVRVSTARRAQLTWAGARTRLSARWDDVDQQDEPLIYEADVPTLLAVVQEAAADASTVVLVGHNPGLADLVAWLATDDARRREALVKFPTASIAVLSTDLPLREALGAPGSMHVVDFAVPRG